MRFSIRFVFVALLGPLAVFIPPAESGQIPAPERVSPASQSGSVTVAAQIREDEEPSV